MTYKLIITEHADKLLNNIMYHLIYRLKNKQAAKHLLNGIEIVNIIGIFHQLENYQNKL